MTHPASMTGATDGATRFARILCGTGVTCAATIAIGGTAGTAAHAAEAPVLIARTAGDGAFPTTVVAASDGSVRDRRVVETAAELAGTGRLVLVHAAGHDGPREPHELAGQTAAASERTGRAPVVVAEREHPVGLVLRVAREHDAGLIVVGSGGRRGLSALGSVSERIAARAGCSVLVMRPGGRA